MKTLKSLFLFALISGSISLYSQSLDICGKFRDNNGNKIKAEYTLSSNGLVIAEGTGTKLKQKLEMNQDYLLEVRQSNKVPRTIRFSTHTSSQETFRFVFEVRMKDQRRNVQATPEKNVVVYYDNKTGTFTYSRI